MEDIKVKSATDLLEGFPVRVSGANKSKVKISIFDRIKKFYYSRKYEKAINKISELKTRKETYDSNMNSRIDDLMVQDNKVEEINNISERNLDYQQKMDKKIEHFQNIAKEAEEKIENIENKAYTYDTDEVKEEKAEEKLDNNHLIDTEKLKEMRAPKGEQEVVVSPEVEEKEESQEVEVEENQEEQVSEVAKAIKGLVDKYNSDSYMMLKTFVISMETIYKEHEKKQILNAVEKTEGIYNKIVEGKNTEITARNVRINELEQENVSLTSDRDQYKSHYEQSNNMLEKSEERVLEQQKEINELQQQLNALQKELDSKDSELSIKDSEIKRLSVYEQSVNSMRQAMGMGMMGEVPTQEEESKTL